MEKDANFVAVKTNLTKPSGVIKSENVSESDPPDSAVVDFKTKSGRTIKQSQRKLENYRYNYYQTITQQEEKKKAIYKTAKTVNKQPRKAEFQNLTQRRLARLHRQKTEVGSSKLNNENPETESFTENGSQPKSAKSEEFFQEIATVTPPQPLGKGPDFTTAHKSTAIIIATKTKANSSTLVVGPYVCSICARTFSKSSNLKRHELIHTGVKPWKCLVCSKRFSESIRLKYHMRTHTGEKPFTCPVCSKSFSGRSSLERHERIHTGQKPYKCSFCPKTFVDFSNRQSHEISHTGIKKFKCSTCQQGFARKEMLLKHQRKHALPV